MDRKGGSATRVFKIAWSDISAFFVDLFPNPLAGYSPVSWAQGFSWVLAQSASAEPFDPTKPGGTDTGSGITYSNFAKVTVEYSPPEMDQQQQPTTDSSSAPGGGGDGTGPGGKKGATGGEKGSTSQPVTLMEHSVHVGAEFLTLSHLILEWEEEPKEVNRTVRAGKVVATIEHQVTWHNVNVPPWDNIKDTAGKVNAAEFLGGPSESVLFLGAACNRTITNQGKKAWTLQYKFSEKQIEPGKGWNHFYRAEEGAGVRIDKLLLRDGTLIYKTSNMRSLYNAEVSPIPPL